MKATEIKRETHTLDARDKTLGRLSTEIANLLRGKGKPTFAPHLDIGDSVVVTHARDIRVTGRKMADKTYIRHSGYPGALRSEQLGDLLKRDPSEVIRRAVAGMLPKNKLRQNWLNRLKVYADEEK